MSVETNAWSTTVDHIAAVAINATVQTTLHDYFSFQCPLKRGSTVYRYPHNNY